MLKELTCVWLGWLQLIGGQDIFKDKEVDPRDMAGLEELISRTEPLWAALSDAIAVLEADLANTHPAGPADAANPNRILSPGATQVSSPLVTLHNPCQNFRSWVIMN